MTRVLNERSLTTEQLMNGGVDAALNIFATAGDELLALIDGVENQKGYMLALSAAFLAGALSDPAMLKAFLEKMAQRGTTIPKPKAGDGQTGPINEYLYFLRTLFGKMVEGKWVPNRTYENWAGPLRYLVSLKLADIADYQKAIDEAEVKVDGKTYRRVEALRHKDWENHPPAKRVSSKKSSPTAPVEIPRAVDRIAPMASLDLPEGKIPMNEDGYAVASLVFRDGKYHVLFGVADSSEITRIVAEGYAAQKDSLPIKQMMVPMSKVAPPVKSAENALSVEA
jgi:hypothetical protein